MTEANQDSPLDRWLRRKLQPLSRDAPLDVWRRRYAEELADYAGMSPAMTEAFASVPRERFVGPGPWTMCSAALEVEVTPDDDVRHIYRNMLVAAGPEGPGNSEPRFWAWMFGQVTPQPGERVAHVGAGSGYFSAVLAEVVGPTGTVVAIDADPQLARFAADALADRPNVTVLAGDAHRMLDAPVDVIVATFGLDTIPVRWVRLLSDGGRLLMPLTKDSDDPRMGGGGILLVTRRGPAFDARFVGQIMISHDATGRTRTATRRLAKAYPRAKRGQLWEPPHVAALHLEGRPDRACWLAGDGWWLSSKPNP